MDIQSEEFFKDRTSLNISPSEYRKVLSEYYELASSETLNESQSWRMHQILHMAESDSTLSILLNAIDEITYQEQELDNSSLDSHIFDEISKVQEMIPDDVSDKLIKYQLTSREMVRLVAPQRANLLWPRVEALSDTNHVKRVRFEKTFFQDVVSMQLNDNALRFSFRKCKGKRYRVRRKLLILRYYLAEESVSILMGVLLAVIILIMFL